MALPTLNLSLQFGDISYIGRHRIALPRHKVARWIRHSLSHDGEITVRIVDAEEGLRLNREFRKKDHATNVLTFDYMQSPVAMADLVLCASSKITKALFKVRPRMKANGATSMALRSKAFCTLSCPIRS